MESEHAKSEIKRLRDQLAERQARIAELESMVSINTAAVACTKARSFCQKCRWLVTARHARTLRMWLCMK